jgi:hypothetical protein
LTFVLLAMAYRDKLETVFRQWHDKLRNRSMPDSLPDSLTEPGPARSPEQPPPKI